MILIRCGIAANVGFAAILMADHKTVFYDLLPRKLRKDDVVVPDRLFSYFKPQQMPLNGGLFSSLNYCSLKDTESLRRSIDIRISVMLEEGRRAHFRSPSNKNIAAEVQLLSSPEQITAMHPAHDFFESMNPTRQKADGSRRGRAGVAGAGGKPAI